MKVVGPARRSILALAYGYDAYDVSESYTAFCLTREIARRHAVTVLTKDSCSGPVPDGVAVRQLPTQARIVPQKFRRALKLDYFSFNRRAWREARSGRLGCFELCHHVSPISLRYPDRLAALAMPFIWGPVGGSIAYPAAFQQVARRDSLLLRLRALDELRLRLDPGLVRTLRRAARIVVTSSAAAALVPLPYRSKTLVIGEGVDAAALMKCPRANANVWGSYVFSSARMVLYKGLDLLLRSYARAGLASQLVITGEGPERPALERLASELGIGSRVHFLGNVRKPQNLALMQGARFCVFPSLKEAFGHVNVEAMAQGKAVIALAHGGPKDIVVNGVTGILVEPIDQESVIQQLANAMELLDSDTQRRAAMGRAGQQRVVNHYDWPAVGKRYLELYEEVLAQHAHGCRDGDSQYPKDAATS